MCFVLFIPQIGLHTSRKWIYCLLKHFVLYIDCEQIMTSWWRFQSRNMTENNKLMDSV